MVRRIPVRNTPPSGPNPAGYGQIREIGVNIPTHGRNIPSEPPEDGGAAVNRNRYNTEG